MVTTLALVFMTWVISGALFGLAGSFVGPGSVMIPVGILVGIGGGIVHVATRLSHYRLRWWNAGICISAVTLLFTLFVMGGDTHEPVITLFLFVFYFVSSTVIFSYTDRFFP